MDLADARKSEKTRLYIKMADVDLWKVSNKAIIYPYLIKLDAHLPMISDLISQKSSVVEDKYFKI